MKIYGICHAAMCPTTEIMIHRTHAIIYKVYAATVNSRQLTFPVSSKKTLKDLADSNKSITFAAENGKGWLSRDNNTIRGVAQLVAFLVWDQAVARSSRVAPTSWKQQQTKSPERESPCQVIFVVCLCSFSSQYSRKRRNAPMSCCRT